MCVSPNSVRVYPKAFKGSKVVSVPCGHCFECVRKRKFDWEMRLTVESSASAHTFFGMLTFNDLFYHSDVDPKEISYYIKRLRYNLDKFYPGATLKYFLVSEYGELKDRLHYHVLYFVSSEFDDTHREFEELCKMSWVCKVPLSASDVEYRRHCFKSWCKRAKPDRSSASFIEYRNWSRRRYDDVSLGFATCQMLRSGSAVGSIHYACKYIQKQYNKMFYSRVGYDAWLEHMISEGKLVYTWDSLHTKVATNHICQPNFLDYPTFPVRGKHYPVPKRWLLNSVGKLYTQFLSQKLAKEYMTKDKFIDEDRIQRFWFDEPERLDKLLASEHAERVRRASDFEERQKFLSYFTDIEKEWLPFTTQKRSLNCPVEVDLTLSTETRLPLRWD